MAWASDVNRIKTGERVLRHFRWRSTELFIGDRSVRAARLIWTGALLGVGGAAGWARGFSAWCPSFLCVLAVFGLSAWLYNILFERPALGWLGYFLAWFSFAGMIMTVPHLVNLGRSLFVLGTVLAVLDLPSRKGFWGLYSMGVAINILLETRYFTVFPSLRSVGLVGLVYLSLPLALCYGLDYLERLYTSGFADELTNIGNRKLLNWLQASIWPPIKRQKRMASVLLLDLDNFKAVNDILGHIAGDRMLKRLAHAIEDEIRQDDIICRYGGDEFVVLLMDSSMHEAVDVAERLRRCIVEVSREELSDHQITTSIGVASYPKHGKSLMELLSRADRALVRDAKVWGRNQVAVALAEDAKESWIDAKWQLPTRARDLIEIICFCTGEAIEHINRLAELGYQLGRGVGLPEARCHAIVQAAALHDTGKAAVPKEVLQGIRQPTSEEKQLLLQHPEVGAAVLDNLGINAAVVNAVRYHLERWDGSGRLGLKAEEIPMEAAILAVADAYDALLHPDTGETALAPKEAVAEIVKHAGTRFNPTVVAEFEKTIIGSGMNKSSLTKKVT
ncbi:MAG: diguanylate cyclase [Firmicutes bacterium]|nr:diguanylate cyclase [Bacillota bacterium]